MPVRRRPKILFVSHIAGRSGAPMLLLEIIRNLKTKTDIPFEILIIKDGEINEEFEKLAKTYRWNKYKASESKKLLNRVLNKLTNFCSAIHHRYILFSVKDIPLIFLNTISNGEIQKRLLSPKKKFICYVHELEAAIHISTTKDSLNTTLRHTNRFIACSNTVKENLIGKYKINDGIIKTIYAPLQIIKREKKHYEDFIGELKNKNNIPPNATIIGVAGNVEWRKGFDLFYPLVEVYFNLHPSSNVRFIWKGLRHGNADSLFHFYNSQKFKHREKSLILPHDSDGIETIACFDIHLLLSYEDPYPLVVLEAASFGIPTVCFADAGGAIEFIEKDCGVAVPYGDLIAMADTLYELTINKKILEEMADACQDKLRLRHTIDKTIPQFLQLLHE